MKKQKGDAIQGILLFLIILSFITYFLYLPTLEKSFRNGEAVPGIKTMQMIDRYKSVASKEVTLSGKKFYGRIDNDNISGEFIYYFSADNLLIKEGVVHFVKTKGETLRDIKLRGSAKYLKQGSVLKYSEIQGDGLLFPAYGEIFEISESFDVTVYTAEGTPIKLGEKPKIDPFSKDNE